MAGGQTFNSDTTQRARFARKVAAIGLTAVLGTTMIAGCSGNDGQAASSDSASPSSSLDIAFSSSVDQDAQQAFRDSAQALLARNAKLESAIAKVQELVDSNPNGVDKKKLDKARSAIKSAKKAERQVPDVALSTTAVKGQATAMNNITYSTQMEKLLSCMDLLQPGAQDEWAQANNEGASGANANASSGASTTIDSEQPVSSSGSAVSSSSSASSSQTASSASSGSADKSDTVLTAKQVAKRIKGVKHVSSTKAATKKNDPNDMIGTKDGYTAAVFFTSDLVDHDAVYGTGILEEGTDGGGCVEVYATKAKAQKRNKYLSKFDDTKIASGSHKVVGTCVVRTSSQLSTPQQKALTKDLTKALKSA